MPNLNQTQGSIWLPLILAVAVASQLASSQSTVTTTQPTPSRRQGSGGEPATEWPMVVSSVNEDELAGARDEPARAAGNKELAPTAEPSSSLATGQPSSPTSTTEASASSAKPKLEQPAGQVLQQAIGRAQQSVAQLSQQAGLADSMPVSMSPELTKSINEFAARLPDSIQSQLSKASSDSSNSSIESLLPKSTSLFNRHAIEPGELAEMDCHLRNVDYCLAGLLAGSQKLLPETDGQLEVRCDEMKATTSCMAIYNKRCGTFKVFSLLVPFAQAGVEDETGLADEQRRLLAQLGRETKLTAEMEAQLLNKNVSSARPRRISMANLMDFCEPAAKTSPENRELRQRLFSLANCINSRVPKLNPCMNDLKAALQVFYEPRRVLPLQPSCCAIARFRACSTEALDRVCGLSSFEQLIESVGGSAGGPNKRPTGFGPMAMLRSIDRVCRQATNHKSAYCLEVLPPSGMRAPQRRGSKASKLSKALDLFSFAPAVQEAGAL